MRTFTPLPTRNGRRVRTPFRTRALRVSAGAFLFAVAVTGIVRAQEIPVRVTDELLQEALADEIEVVAEPREAPRSGSWIPIFVWMAGMAAAAITVPRLRAGGLSGGQPLRVGFLWGRRAAAEEPIGGEGEDGAESRSTGASSDAVRDAEDVLDLSEYRRSKARSRKPVEPLKVPPHVAQILARANQRKAEQAAGGPAVDEPSTPPAPAPREGGERSGLDIVVPRYDPRE